MSFDIFKAFATDEQKEAGGTWVSIGSGARLLVARTGNRKYAKMLLAEGERNKEVLDLDDDHADQVSNDLMAKVIANTILLGWEGVWYKGLELPYSTANAEMLLKLKDFRRLVMKHAEDINNFRAQEEAAEGEA